jgi:hypothetical protein
MPGYDHPNGGSYETQEERFGSGRNFTPTPRKPIVDVQRTVTFTETSIKKLIQAYVKDTYNEHIELKDISMSVKESKGYSQLDWQPESCKFTVRLKG